MFLSRFGVKRYKCLGEIDIPLTPIHVLIGENDAGKTSLLEAMAAFYASSEKPLSEVFPKPWTGRDLVLHESAQSSVEFSGEWTTSPAEEEPSRNSPLRYGFAVDFPGDVTNCAPRKEVIEVRGEDRCLSPETEARPASTTVALCTQSDGYPDEIAAADYMVLRQVLQQAHVYAFNARIMAVPAAIDPERKFRLAPDGFGLATLLLDILGHDPERFMQLRREFCHFFPQFMSVRVESEPALARTYDSSGMHTSKRGGPVW